MPRPRRDKQPPRETQRRKLTDRIVKTAKPEATRILIYDELQHGLALSVEPTAHKSYKLVYTFHGRPRWYNIGDVRSIGLAQARKRAKELLAAVVLGTDVQAEKARQRQAGTFGEVAERYVEQYSKRNNKSWKQADALVRTYLLPHWRMRPIVSITRTDMKEVLRRLRPVLANQVKASASALFNWAIREEIAKDLTNPCIGIEPNATSSRERVLSASEIPQFWAAFDDLDLTRGRALRMILLTGQRPGEIRHMRREHIEIGEHRFTDENGRDYTAKGAWWSLPGQPDVSLGWPGTKNAQSHRVWLNSAALEILDEVDEERGRGFVFASARKGPIAGLDGAMKRTCKKLKLVASAYAKPHDLRRTHGTLITSLGFTREQMNRIQNHVEGGIGSVYDRHGYAHEARKIQEAVAARILSLVNPQAPSNVVALGA
jgi:integrase